MIINTMAYARFNKQEVTLNYKVFEVIIWHLPIPPAHAHGQI